MVFIFILTPINSNEYWSLNSNTAAADVPPFLLPPPDAFPQNIKSLTLKGHLIMPWKDLSVVGKLPKLEYLQVIDHSFSGKEWEVADEGFPHLKFLLLCSTNIEYWRASSDQFPCLEQLFLDDCSELDSIPQEFADITTLALIDITCGFQSLEYSARQIQQDNEDNYGDSIKVYTRGTWLDILILKI